MPPDYKPGRRWEEGKNVIYGDKRMNEFRHISIISLCLVIAAGSLAGCQGVTPVATATSTIAPATATLTPLPTLTMTPSPTLTPTPVDTLEPEKITETLQPLFKDPMNCDVPCFWGIIPGKTRLSEARVFFSRLGFIPYEGKDQNSPSSGMYFYTISYDTGTGHDSSMTILASNDVVENIEITPYIIKQIEGSPRKWIAYSPETLIKRYGKPSHVEFTVSSLGSPDIPMNIGISMIMYFDTWDLVVHYSGYNMDPNMLCPLTAPFDSVGLWIGPNPPDSPYFETVSLEKATSLTIDQFTQLLLENHQHACLTLKEDAFQ
jgi:hypothetical protein